MFPPKMNTSTAIQWSILSTDKSYTTHSEFMVLVKWESLFHYFDLLNIKSDRTCVDGFLTRLDTLKCFYSIFLNGMLYLRNLFHTNSSMSKGQKTTWTMIVPWVDGFCSHQLCAFRTERAHLICHILSLLLDDNLEQLEKHWFNVGIFSSHYMREITRSLISWNNFYLPVWLWGSYLSSQNLQYLVYKIE